MSFEDALWPCTQQARGGLACPALQRAATGRVDDLGLGHLVLTRSREDLHNLTPCCPNMAACGRAGGNNALRPLRSGWSSRCARPKGQCSSATSSLLPEAWTLQAGPSSRPWTPSPASQQWYSTDSAFGKPSDANQNAFVNVSPVEERGFFSARQPTPLSSSTSAASESLLEELLQNQPRTKYASPQQREKLWKLFSELCNRATQGDFTIDALSPKTWHAVVSTCTPFETEDRQLLPRQSSTKPRQSPLSIKSGQTEAEKRRQRHITAKYTEHSKAQRTKGASSVFAHRARYILQQAKQAEYRTGKLPLIRSSYNHLLEQAAFSADLDTLREVWQRLCETSFGASGTSYRAHILGLHQQYTNLADQQSSASKRKQPILSGQQRQLAVDAVGLVDEMLRADLKVSSNFVERIAKMLSHTSNLQALHHLVRSCYGVDLKAPDQPVGRSIVGGQKGVLSTHLTNTIIEALGTHSTISETVAVWETLARPLVSSSLAVGQPDSSSLFAVNFRGLFSNESNHQSETVLDSESPAVLSGQPNKFSFVRMIRHACLADAEVGTPAFEALSPLQQKEAEARALGQYVPVAKYLLDDALDFYEAEILRVIRELGLKVVMEEHAAHDLTEAEQPESRGAVGQSQVNAAAALATLQATSSDAGTGSSVASPSDETLLSSWTTSPQLPIERLRIRPGEVTQRHTFNPPYLVPDFHLFAPLWRRAYTRRNIGLVTWLRERLNRAQGLMRLEGRAIRGAIKYLDPERHDRVLRDDGPPAKEAASKMDESLYNSLASALKYQGSVVSQKRKELEKWDQERLQVRLDAFRKARNNRANRSARAKKLNLAAQAELKQQKALLKANAREARESKDTTVAAAAAAETALEQESPSLDPESWKATLAKN